MKLINTIGCIISFLTLLTEGNESIKCGEVITQTKGIIQTPGFPRRYPVPIDCTWVIDASRFRDQNYTIIVYLTQLYVTSGLTFTDFTYYDESRSDYKFGQVKRHTVTPENVTSAAWLRTSAPVFEIRYSVDRLEGNQLRFLDDKQNVYFMFGFNITYEIVSYSSYVKDSCNPKLCSLLGDCYASSDMSSYECVCFQGYSGKDCGQGPLCERDVCKNGATCRQVSAVAVGCQCLEGFGGSMCEVPLNTVCESYTCNHGQCPYNGDLETACKCNKTDKPAVGRANYELTLTVSNSTVMVENLLPNGHWTKSFEQFLARQLTKYFRENRIKIEQIVILNVSSRKQTKVTLHFVGNDGEADSIKYSLKEMVHRGWLGNITWINGSYELKKEPTLKIQSVSVSQKTVRIGEEYSISCIARGSPHLSFSWFKNGVFFNVTRSQRNIIDYLNEINPGEWQYTIVLDKAHVLDEGNYTCHVSDWGVQECQSVYLRVLKPPRIKITPMSATVEKGENLDIRCIPLDNNVIDERYGYSWIKNKQLLKMTPGSEVWEDLFISHYNEVNLGSVLEITNIQKSATYTCQMQGAGVSNQQSVDIEVVNKTVVAICPAEGRYGVAWPSTVVNRETIADCPLHAEGFVKRHCSLINTNTPQWQVPDFSNCLYKEFEDIYNNFTRLTLGFQVTTCLQTLQHTYIDLVRRTTLFPGESGPILNLLNDIQTYSNVTGCNHHVSGESKSLFYKIINQLLSREYSVINEQQIHLLQKLVINEAILLNWKQEDSIHVNLSDITIDIITLDNTLHSERYSVGNVPYTTWLNDKAKFNIDSTQIDLLNNKSLVLGSITYKNLSQFLPPRCVVKLSDGFDLEYEVNSVLHRLEFGNNGTIVNPNGLNYWVDIEFDHIIKEYNKDEWKMTCGVAETASYTSPWDLASCSAIATNFNTTRCQCNKSGTYALLLVSRLHTVYNNSEGDEFLTLLIGCGCCLIQSMLTLILILPYWWRHKTCIVYLKLQSCLATGAAMAIFIHSVHNVVPKAMFPLVTTLLVGLLLIGSSSHLSKVLIVYSEIIQLPSNKHMKSTVVCVVTGVPLLTVLCNYLGHHSTGWNLESWWLLRDTTMFNVFVTSILIMFIFYIFLYFIVMRKLRLLASRNCDKNKTIAKRSGLLKRSFIIMFTMVLTESSSVYYINVLDFTSQFLFGLSSALLGFVLLFCYVIDTETPFCYKLIKKLKMDANTDDDFSSESIINPLSFFTKQDGEAESEAAAPRRTSTVPIRGRELRNSSSNSVDVSEQLLMSETRLSNNEDVGNSTLETYVYSAASSVEESKTRLFNNEVPSPSIYKPMTSFRFHDSEYVEQDTADEWKNKPDVAQCFIKDASGGGSGQMITAQEIITTRVCVELGVITTTQKNNSGEHVDTPAIVLCSVDVEPCQSRVVEVAETITQVLASGDTLCCNGTITEAAEIIVSSTTPVTTEKQSSPTVTTPATTATTVEEERKQPEGHDYANINGDNIEGMLDRISHDLDYLLNRVPFPPNNANTARKSSKPPGNSVRGRIQEEDEDVTSPRKKNYSTES